MMIDTEELRKLLVELSDEQRAKSAGKVDVPPMVYGAMSALTTLILWLHKYAKGEETMDNLKSQLKVKLVSLDDIPQRERKSELQDSLIEKINEFVEHVENVQKYNSSAPDSKRKPVPALAIEEGITYHHLSNKVSRLRRANKIPNDIKVVKSGQSFFIVKK